MECTIQIDVTAENIDQAIAAIEELCSSQLAPLTDAPPAESEHQFGFSSEDADVTACVLFGAPEPLGLGLDAEEAQELAAFEPLPL